jgi:hypothetical protein
VLGKAIVLKIQVVMVVAMIQEEVALLVVAIATEESDY